MPISRQRLIRTERALLPDQRKCEIEIQLGALSIRNTELLRELFPSRVVAQTCHERVLRHARHLPRLLPNDLFSAVSSIIFDETLESIECLVYLTDPCIRPDVTAIRHTPVQISLKILNHLV